MICQAIIKKSNKKCIWQIKNKDHDIRHLAAMHDIIEKCMFLSGIDFSNRSLVHRLIYGDEPFDGYQMKLVADENYTYHLVNNKTFGGKAYILPEMLKYFKITPNELYIRIETANIIGLRNIEIIKD